MGNSFEQFLRAELAEWEQRGLSRQSRVVTSAAGPRIRIGNQEFLNFASNDYLGLANDPLLKHAASEAIAKWGIGASASRLICGNSEPYALLEEKLARFKKKEAAIVFGSGYAANVGVISSLVGKGDTMIVDKLCHASIIDGARMSGAIVRVYPHKNLKRLEELLSMRETSAAGSPISPSSHSLAPAPTLVITETVFSMDGDLAPLQEIVALKEKYGAWLMIDEAHATGFFSENGRGLAEEAGVEDLVEITMGTLSKAFGCQGGYVVGSRQLIEYLRNKARSLIYSTAMPPAIVAATASAVDFIASAEGKKRRDQLWRNVNAMRHALASLGLSADSRSPIMPVIVGNEAAAIDLSRQLFEQGIFVPAIRYPTVPKGKARLRVTVTAGHSHEDIQTFHRVFASLPHHSKHGKESAARPNNELLRVAEDDKRK